MHYNSHGKSRSDKSGNRHSETICFPVSNRCPKGRRTQKGVPKPLYPKTRDEGGFTICKSMDLTVFFQRFGGTRIAPLGTPDRHTDRDESRAGLGPGRAGRRPARCPPRPHVVHGHPTGRKQKVSRSRGASPPFTPIHFDTKYYDFSIKSYDFSTIYSGFSTGSYKLLAVPSLYPARSQP